MPILLPSSDSPLRQLFDVADLAVMAAPGNRRNIPWFRRSLASAKEYFEAERSARAINVITLRADGQLWLVRINRTGTWKRLWNFGQLV